MLAANGSIRHNQAGDVCRIMHSHQAEVSLSSCLCLKYYFGRFLATWWESDTSVESRETQVELLVLMWIACSAQAWQLWESHANNFSHSPGTILNGWERCGLTSAPTPTQLRGKYMTVATLDLVTSQKTTASSSEGKFARICLLFYSTIQTLNCLRYKLPAAWLKLPTATLPRWTTGIQGY